MSGEARESRGHPVFAARYDRLGRSAYHDPLAEVAGGASGRVLEIGAGTGFNCVHFTDRARAIVAIEPDPRMLQRNSSRESPRRHGVVQPASS